MATGSSLILAADTIKSYTSTLYELDNADANNKKIRLLYAVQNAWNVDHIPESIKEVKLVLTGGSGFDMTNVPNKATLYEYTFGGDYRYTVPTAFQLRVNYHDGAAVRHWDHQPSNTISTSHVTKTSDFSLGITSGSPPVISGGASWSTNVRYEQAEFETVADYNQNNSTVTWDICNKTIRHNTPAKDWLLWNWNCSSGNLVPYSELPVVMRSDFRPEASILYRKQSVADQNNTRLGLRAAWTKTNYHYARDWCSWHTNFSWKGYTDYSQSKAHLDNYGKNSGDLVADFYGTGSPAELIVATSITLENGGIEYMVLPITRKEEGEDLAAKVKLAIELFQEEKHKKSNPS